MRIWLAVPAFLFAWLGFCGAAGRPSPLIMRTVTLGSETGVAYYSRVEQGYRFVARPRDSAPENQTAGLDAAAADRVSSLGSN